MTHLTKLTFKTVDRSVTRDPIIARRDKLVAGLKEQKLVHAATLKKEDHLVERSRYSGDRAQPAVKSSSDKAAAHA
jgi:hypothetical protein